MQINSKKNLKTKKTVLFKIKRQFEPKLKPFWEHFEIPHSPNSNVISYLMDIRKDPINSEGNKVPPIVWDCSCLEEVCGTCTMRINGKVRQSCSALVDKLKWPITLEPMSKFPVMRDLSVDRSRMFEALKKVKAWVPVDGYHDLGPGERIHPEHQKVAYELSKCMTCGCCVEACPQYSKDNDFLGAAALSQVRLFNMHPTGKNLKKERLTILMEKGGISDCGNAQNCVEACPRSIPLTESIAHLGKDVSKQMWKNIFSS